MENYKIIETNILKSTQEVDHPGIDNAFFGINIKEHLVDLFNDQMKPIIKNEFDFDCFFSRARIKIKGANLDMSFSILHSAIKCNGFYTYYVKINDCKAKKYSFIQGFNDLVAKEVPLTILIPTK